VKLVINTGRPAGRHRRSRARSKEQTLGRWVKNYKDRQAGGERALTETEFAELLRLRKDNADLRLDRTFLKEASVFFAQEASDTNTKRSN